MWNWTRNNLREKLAAESDFGRRFGWSVIYQGRQVAELDYVRWEEATQFWHSYKVRWLESGDLSSIPFEKWQELGFILRNKKYHQIEFGNYMSAVAIDGTVLLRGPCVPAEVLVL